jgi:chromosomal replication initiation ATPase DnaA
MTIWDQVLERLRSVMPPEEYRRWFIATAYASDSGDQITVWVPTESVRRHISRTYHDEIDEALVALGRTDTQVRLVVGGLDEDDEIEE